MGDDLTDFFTSVVSSGLTQSALEESLSRDGGTGGPGTQDEAPTAAEPDPRVSFFAEPYKTASRRKLQFQFSTSTAETIESEIDGLIQNESAHRRDSVNFPPRAPPRLDARIVVDDDDVDLDCDDRARVAKGEAAPLSPNPVALTGCGQNAFPALESAIFVNNSVGEIVLDGSRTPPVVIHANRAKFMYPYQVDGVRFLWDRFKQNNGGLLADEMGLGKTVQVAVFLASILNYGTAEDSVRDPNAAAGKDPVLIVGPASILDNWKKDLLTWVGNINVKKFASGEATALLRQLTSPPKERGRLHPDVILATYDGATAHMESFFAVAPWSVLIFDEAHILKNPRTNRYEAFKRLRQPRRFGLSGTPLQNSLKEYHTLFAILLQEHSWPDWNSFQTEFVNFIKAGRDRDASVAIRDLGIEKRNRLLKLTNKFMKRSTKDLLPLPPKEDFVHMRDMSEGQSDLYFAVHESYDQEMVLLALANVPCPLCKVKSKAQPEPFWKCCKIYPRTTDQKKRAPHWRGMAGHQTKNPNDYLPCLRCPYCLIFPLVSTYTRISNHPLLLFPTEDDDVEGAKRKSLVTEFLFGPRYEERGKELGMVHEMAKLKHSSKLDVLSNLLQQCYRSNHKCLIFSSLSKILDIIEASIVARYRYRRLDGKVPKEQRQGIIDEYNSDPSVFVFLMTVKAGGVGINVTSADTVFIFDPNWNPIYDLQAQDRVHRLNQKKKVRIYRLFGSNTIEEYMYKKQLTKQQLSAEVVDEESVARYFNVDEVNGAKNLFAFDGRQFQRQTGTQIAMVQSRAAQTNALFISHPAPSEEPSHSGWKAIDERKAVQRVDQPRRLVARAVKPKRQRSMVGDLSNDPDEPMQDQKTVDAAINSREYTEENQAEEIEKDTRASLDGMFTQKMQDVFDEVGDGANPSPLAHFTTMAGKTSVFNLRDVNERPGREGPSNLHQETNTMDGQSERATSKQVTERRVANEHKTCVQQRHPGCQVSTVKVRSEIGHHIVPPDSAPRTELVDKSTSFLTSRGDTGEDTDGCRSVRKPSEQPKKKRVLPSFFTK